ncbi:ATPase [PVC group bacterium (ex Bugula neritina AB1)]|nr:ATPase [PVC group bacterium (ex Bugula neritina AB1)]
MDIREVNEQVKEQVLLIQNLFEEMGKVIVGQRSFIETLVLGMLTGGHVLVEGVPGLAKTLAVNTLSDTMGLDFQRVQFTPDLLPADIVGTMIYNPKDGDFSLKKGPVFHSVLLADEINRSPAKVQSALLEAMQEKQVTIGGETFPMDDVFFVIATQNSIEQEGTYPLPEAQIDRFMFKTLVSYPSKEEEKEILNRMSSQDVPVASAVLDREKICLLRKIVDSIYIDEKIKNYIVEIVFTSRYPEKYGLKHLKNLFAGGASPRATLSLTKAAKANAFISGRGYVIPEDVKRVGLDVLRHRVFPSFEAEAEEVSSDVLIQHIFDEVEVP